MLCETKTPEQARELCKSGEWIIEQKIDGCRGYIKDKRLYNRRGEDITEKFPEFADGLQSMNGVFDGELLTTSGEFGDIQGRMHMKDKFLISVLVKKSPARFVLFDVLDSEEDDTPLIDRKKWIAKLVDTGVLPSWVMPLRWSSDFDDMWRQVEENGWEGVVIKKANSRYENRRSNSWVKVKSWCETDAEFVKFEEHTHGITIETADGRRININGALAPPVKHKLIKDGKVTCEVQYMKSALAGSDAWRFASYRGMKLTTEVKHD